MNKKYEAMTMAQVKKALNESIDKYNLSTDTAERVELSAEHAEMKQAFNELSLLSAYAECMKAEHPVVALVKMFYYPTVNYGDKPHSEVINGKTVTTITRSLKDGNANLNVVKFIQWTAECNKCVAASATWMSDLNKSRNIINGLWKAYMEAADYSQMSKNKVKGALQSAFDALVFIKSESGKNAIVADGKQAGYVVAAAADAKANIDDAGSVAFTLEFLKGKKWQDLLMHVLHMAVEGKTYDITYGDPEEDAKKKGAPSKSKDKSKDKAPATDKEQA